MFSAVIAEKDSNTQQILFEVRYLSLLVDKVSESELLWRCSFDSNLKDFVFGFDFGQSLAEKGDGEEALIRGKDETDVKVCCCWCPHS